MAMSNYPSAFRGGALLKGAPLHDMIDGDIYWVSSGSGGAGNSGAFASPMDTIQGGIDLCTANNNDVIYIKPGHAETISDATTIVADCAGITIVGLGRGTSRPTITFDNASSSIAISAADVTFQNFDCYATAADVAVGVTVTGKNAVIADFLFSNSGAAKNWLSLALVGTTDNAADGLTFLRCHWVDPDLSTESVVDVDGDVDGLVIKDSYVVLGINGVLSSLVEVAAGKDTTDINLDGNFVNRLVAASAIQLITWVDTTTTNTGVSRNNLCVTRDTAGALYSTAGSNVHHSFDLSTAAVDKSGFIENPDS